MCTKNINQEIIYQKDTLYDINDMPIDYEPMPGQPVRQLMDHAIIQGVVEHEEFHPQAFVRFQVPIVEYYEQEESGEFTCKTLQNADPVELVEVGAFDHGSIIRVLNEKYEPIAELTDQLYDEYGIFYVGYYSLEELSSSFDEDREDEVENIKAYGEQLGIEFDVDDELDDYEELQLIPYNQLHTFMIQYSATFNFAKMISSNTK